VQPNRFVVLTGHLSNYPLSDLVGILRHQRKTGRLLIEYPKGPATFFFQDGELIDAQLNDLTGLQAIVVAMSMPESSFNFNPLIKPSRRSVDRSLQRVVSELLGCWDESAVQIESSASAVNSQPRLLTTQQCDEAHALPPGKTAPLALSPAPSITIPRRYFLASSLVVVIIGFPIVIAMSRGFRTSPAPSDTVPNTVSAPSQERVTESYEQGSAKRTTATRETAKNRWVAQDSHAARTRQESKDRSAANLSPAAAGPIEKSTATPASGTQSISIVMQIENGRILKASVANHKPGMDSYEALALRIARQRRYPEKVNGQETVRITVSRSN
jgi:hypothetical protein